MDEQEKKIDMVQTVEVSKSQLNELIEQNRELKTALVAANDIVASFMEMIGDDIPSSTAGWVRKLPRLINAVKSGNSFTENLGDNYTMIISIAKKYL